MDTPIPLDDRALGELTLHHLETVVAIDSQSDETSSTIPSSEGQRRLSELVARFFAGHGAAVETDPHGNVIATLPGRGAGADAPPIALLVHLDTARGTAAVPHLHRAPAWDGSPVHYPGNPALRVDVATYPQLAEFVGHTIVHGPGVAPFGLDDKLGLAHMMTLATVLAREPALAHPPLLLIGRPDEEIGRMEAVTGLAALLAARGVRSGYTIDGILPFEVNTANFNGAHASLVFAGMRLASDDATLALELRGVNTHGATAHAEGHRAATRLAVEILAAAPAGVAPLTFDSDALRDCDGTLVVSVPASARADLEAAARRVTDPHAPRGAGVTLRDATADEIARATTATASMLSWVRAFLASSLRAPASDRTLPLLAEDSFGWLGYSHPYRAHTDPDGSVRLDVRLRDFDPALLEARKAHVAALAVGHAEATLRDQYVDMGPRLATRPDLAAHAVAAAADVGVSARQDPIRGGTGVDPFLDMGTAIANLGTGYFAPESEKELTSLELMAGHARWLVALVGRLAAVRG
ncbi:MAG: hypothetical protein IT385_20355 [Deltaproteobacteria bacterium]|nr:hypothetical protein [Deltaproteobacteria bacterium]